MARTIDEQVFIDEVHASSESNQDVNFVFFIGAGCSSSSGIPTATELTEKWRAELQKTQPTKLSKLKDTSTYFEVFKSAFPHSIDQQREIKRLCQGKTPSFGYYMLAQLMQKMPLTQ